MPYLVPNSKTIFASAARTASHNGDDQINLGYRGCHIFIDATSITNTPSVTFTLQGKDRTSGKYYTILTSSAVATVSTAVMRVYPGLQTFDFGGSPTADVADVANVANDVLPECWRLIATHGDSDSITYSVGVSLLP